MNNEILTLTLNEFDAEGILVDTVSMDISATQASDIIDHAAQLLIIATSLNKGESSIVDFNNVLAKLHESLSVADVIAEGIIPAFSIDPE